MLSSSTKIMSISSNIVAIILCLLVLANFGSNIKRKKDLDNYIFTNFVIFCIVLFAVDSVTWILNGEINYYKLNYFSNVVFFSMQTGSCFLWIAYCNYKLYESMDKYKRTLKLSIIPIAIVVFIASMSFKYPFMFSIDEYNVYQRGPYYYVYALFNMSLLFYSVFIILKKDRNDNIKNKRNDGKLILMAYPILPIVGAMIQTFYSSVNIIWLLSSVSVIIIYFNFQNNELVIDPLTRVNNRYKFDYYLERFFSDSRLETNMFIAIIDIDKFKKINDTYGYHEGDFILIELANLIKRAVSEKDFIARLGGDEFAVVGVRGRVQQIDLTLEDIQTELDLFNEELRVNKEYRVSVSMGYSYQNDKNRKSKIQMLTEADNNMYIYKTKYATSGVSEFRYQ